MTSPVSFTIHPPTTSSRTSTHPKNPVRAIAPRNNTFIPHAIDSSDEDGEDGAIEAVTGFDQAGAQRLHEKPKASGPLVIPALANRDWRAVARIRKQVVFIPDGVAIPTGRDGSQGGLGTRDSINAGPQAAGLVIRKKLDPAGAIDDGSVKDESVDVLNETLEKSEEDEDERARRALLANVAGGSDEHFTIDAIPVSNNNFSTPVDETDAYKQDVLTRPESATLADYERVPVSQFGAALLRGMGWKEGTAASRTRPGLVEPWLPTSRPALLGIGAKERPQEDIPSATKGGYINQRPEKRYVPVVKLQREGPEHRSRSRSPSRSRTVSRVPSSNSASPYPGDDNRERLRHQRGSDTARDERILGRSGRHSDRERRDPDRDSYRDRRKERGDNEWTRDRGHEQDEWTQKEKGHKRNERERYSKARDRRDRY
ncbi:DExH-box splicing factor binding site-domain-containing protein [Gautieria morchelliformis]|nr:DExH-box splicing factor binding site-domain-containing protein [Gautieria morchelliformis]